MSGCEKRLIKSKSGLRIIHAKDSERSPFELSEPEWMKDNQSGTCLACQASFDFIRRKHHCRRCGQIYCNPCTKARLPLPRMCFLDPVRLCSACAKITTQENNFYEKDMKILLAGGLLLVDDHSSDSTSAPVHCSLSSNHRCLFFSGTPSKSISLVNISTVSPLKMEDDNENSGALTALSLVVSAETKTMVELKVPPEPATDVPHSFLESLQRALQMVNEAKPVIGTGN